MTLRFRRLASALLRDLSVTASEDLRTESSALLALRQHRIEVQFDLVEQPNRHQRPLWAAARRVSKTVPAAQNCLDIALEFLLEV